MTRIATVTADSAVPSVQQMYSAVQKKLGRVPNLMQTLGHSPAALGGYLALNQALSEGELSAKDRERIALAVAQYNDCGYCLAAHSAIGKMTGLTEEHIHSVRLGQLPPSPQQALLAFVQQVLDNRGHVSNADVEEIRTSGYSDGAIAEIVAHISLNVLTNYFNGVAETEIDFPQVDALPV